MFRNYIKVITRNVSRNWLYTSINILGLSLGFAAFVLTAIYIKYETSFENFHSKSSRIYRPTYLFDSGNGYNAHWARIPLNYINELPIEFPEIEKLIRFQNHEQKYVRIGETKFRPNHAYITDQDVFELFDLPFIAGDSETALKEPNSIVITESLAMKYFGSTDALGRDINVLGDWSMEETPHIVTGIIKDLPSNTHLPIEMLISFQNGEERSGWAYVYILLQEDANIESVSTKMPDFIQKYADEDNANKIDFEFQALNDIHLNSNLAREIIPNGNKAYISIFIAVGIFILLVALANYMNLNSALVLGRSKEVGLRKILGASKMQMLYYLLIESISHNLLGLIIGGLIALLVFPYFSTIVGIEFIFNPWSLLFGMCCIAVICGIITGLYPAIVINKDDPIKTINQSQVFSFRKKGSSLTLKKVLSAMQYCVSILLIGSAFIAKDQFSYLNKKNLGIQRAQVLAIPSVPDGVKDDFKLFKDRLSGKTGILGVSGCMEVPSREIRDAGPVLVQGVNDDPEKAPIMDMQVIDHDYIDILGIELLAGNNINQSLTFEPIPEFTEEFTYQDYLASKRRAYIINETAMKQLGWETPEKAIGQEVSWSIGSFKLAYGPITGIVKDYHQETLKNTIDPTIMVFEPIWLKTFLIKIDTDHIQASIETIKSTWDELFPQYPFEYHFLDDMYEELYKNERVKLHLLYLLSGLAIIISFIGLFGLIAYSLKTRVKEIAIRKVLGADMSMLIKLISKEYMIILAISAIIAIPLSYYFVDQWLQQFAYKTDISAFNYVLTIALIGSLIVITTSLQTIKTSLINPADTLRDE